MATKKSMCILFAVLAVVATTDLSAQGTDPRIGTWKLNSAESTFDPGPPPKSYTRTYVDRGGGVTLFTAEGISAQGNPVFLQVAYKLDGKDYPQATTGAQTVSSISQKLVDPFTVEVIIKTGGKVTSIGTQAVSRDGGTLIYRAKGTDAQGRPTSFVQVFERR